MANITIPGCCGSVFTVYLNGKKYVYPAGETVDVPDEVAAIIESHGENPSTLPEQNVEKPFPAGGADADGGAKSWSDLGEEIVEHEELVILDYARFSPGETLVVPEQIIPGCTYRVSFNQISPTTVTATGTSITVDGVTISNSGEDSLYFIALMQNYTYVTIIREAYEETITTPLDPKYLPTKVYYVAYNEETTTNELYKDADLTIGVTIDDYETILGAEIIGVTDGTPNSYKGLCISASKSSSGGFSVRYWDTASANVAYSSDYVAFNP